MNREYKLPEILYKLLAEHNMTQQQLAYKLVCGQNTIYKWLRKDVMPNLCFIMQMSEIFEYIYWVNKEYTNDSVLKRGGS